MVINLLRILCLKFWVTAGLWETNRWLEREGKNKWSLIIPSFKRFTWTRSVTKPHKLLDFFFMSVKIELANSPAIRQVKTSVWTMRIFFQGASVTGVYSISCIYSHSLLAQLQLTLLCKVLISASSDTYIYIHKEKNLLSIPATWRNPLNCFHTLQINSELIFTAGYCPEFMELKRIIYFN